MPRGNLWAIYAILQFINRIIVTLHFFCRSKLFYFSKFFNFDFRLWIKRVDIVGVGIIKNSLSLTGGPGGRPSPSGSGRRIPGCVRPGFKKSVSFTIYYRPWRFWSNTPYRFWFFAKKLNFTQKWPKREKTQKSLEWRDIHRVGYAKIQLLKNINFWFLGRMREILEVHRWKTNNRQNSATNFWNSEISTLRCLESRECYQEVKSVSKSDKNWICYSDFKKDVSS